MMATLTGNPQVTSKHYLFSCLSNYICTLCDHRNQLVRAINITCMYVWMYICNSPCWQNMILVFDLSLWICYKITSLFSRQLVFHIFADLLQSSLNDFRVHYNCRKIRKQNGLSLPSGHSPNVMWGSPHIFDENASK